MLMSVFKTVRRKALNIPIAMLLATGVVALMVSCQQPDEPGVSEIENIDVALDLNGSRRLGAPQIAVNPKDPNNIIVLASVNMGMTLECQKSGDPNCELIPQYVDNASMGKGPRGFMEAGFSDVGIFVSNDGGKKFHYVDVSMMTPIGHPEINAKGEGPLAVTNDEPNGTFYVGFNAINWGEWEADPPYGFPNGGVGMIKSTDKGETWQGAWLTQTPADWPFGTSDMSTGKVYVSSGTPQSTLGKRSTGETDVEESEIADRWIGSSVNGEDWNGPFPLGGENALGNHVAGSHSAVAAAHGIVSTLFQISNRRSCQALLGKDAAMPCIIFQTSENDGETWERHRVPVPDGFEPGSPLALFPAANPASGKRGHFAAVLMSKGAGSYFVFATSDRGKTWSKPVEVTEDASKKHWGNWVEYSEAGELGIMWKTNEAKPIGSKNVNPPYSIWAAISMDGGKTFSKPLKVSNHNSPPPPNEKRGDYWNGHVGDHGPSGMALDGARKKAYIAWGDWTPGERTIMFAPVDYDTFKF